MVLPYVILSVTAIYFTYVLVNCITTKREDFYDCKNLKETVYVLVMVAGIYLLGFIILLFIDIGSANLNRNLAETHIPSGEYTLIDKDHLVITNFGDDELKVDKNEINPEVIVVFDKVTKTVNYYYKERKPYVIRNAKID